MFIQYQIKAFSRTTLNNTGARRVFPRYTYTYTLIQQQGYQLSFKKKITMSHKVDRSKKMGNPTRVRPLMH